MACFPGNTCVVCVDKAAVDICVKCYDMFCASCSQAHTQQAVSTLHKVRSLSSLTAERLAARRPDTCDVHDDQVSKLYCPTHDMSICLFCATEDHHQCPDVAKLKTKMAEARSMLADLAAMLSRGEKELEEAMAGLDKDLQEIDQRTQDTVAAIQAACDRMEESLKACRRRLTELTLSPSRDAKESVSRRKTAFMQRKGKATTHRIIVERAERFPAPGSRVKMGLQMEPRVHALDLSTILPPDVKDISMVTMVVDRMDVCLVEQELERVSLVPVLRFHENHDKNLRLSLDSLTAEKINQTESFNILMSQEPMMPNLLYQVHIVRIEDYYRYTHLGVASNSPDSFTLPESFCYQAHSAVQRINPDSVSIFGVYKEEEWPVLADLPAGTMLGLAVHRDRTLHLYVNVKDQGVVAPDMPSNCYFMIDLYNRCTEVTALPVTPIP